MGAVLLLVCWFSLSKILHCSASDNWITQFLQGKKVYDQISTSVASGGRIGIQECGDQFRWDVWNCSLTPVSYRLPIFVKTILPNGNKETAFIHAISTAGIVHTLTRNCSRGNFDGCLCLQVRRHDPHKTDWQWGGCSDNVKFGEVISRRFVDDLEQGKGARTAMNLQNNEVGRKVVRNSMLRDCKCHGVSGSCEIKTCWKTLSPFSDIGNTLKNKYYKAKYIKYHDNKVFIVPFNRTKISNHCKNATKA